MVRWSAWRGVALLVGVAFGWMLAGCNRPEPPTIEPRSVAVGNVTAQGLTAKVVLDVHNPNGFALKAQKVQAKVVLGGKVTLGPVNVDSSFELPADRTTALSVDIPATWSSAAEITSLAAASATIPYVVQGTVRIGGKSLNAKVPFEIEGKVTRAELLKAGLQGLPVFKLPSLGP